MTLRQAIEQIDKQNAEALARQPGLDPTKCVYCHGPREKCDAAYAVSRPLIGRR